MSTRDEYVKALIATAENLAKRVVMKRLVSFAPMFATGFLNYVAVRIVAKVIEALMQDLEFRTFFVYIDMRVNEQGSDFSQAAIAWYNAKPEEKAQYEKEYLKKFYALASLKS